MLENRLAVAAFGIACVAAAGGGSYLATRHNATSPVEPVALSAAAPLASSPSAAVVPVQETEAVVGDAAKPLPKPAAPAVTPARRPTPPARPAARPSKAPASTSAANRSQPPSLDRTWPNSAATAPAADGVSNDGTGTSNREEPPAAEVVQAVEPPQPTFQELVVSTNSVIGLRTERSLSSERARIEDRVDAAVVRDVRVDGQVAIPAGTKAIGSVIVVERGGKFKEKARLGIRFHTLVMADGSRLPITTETVYRLGDAPGNGSAARIGGGAVVGTILGAIIGGGKGAAIGAATGAGAGTAAAAAGDRSEATFPAGEEVTARVLAPVTVTLEK